MNNMCVVTKESNPELYNDLFEDENSKISIEIMNKRGQEIYDELKNVLDKKDKEKDILKKENNDLRKLYQRTYKHLFDIGKDELARYFQAQIDECPTFYAEPIVDYYEEYKRLNNIINELEKYIEEKNSFYKISIMGYSYGVTKDILDKLQELKEGIK